MKSNNGKSWMLENVCNNVVTIPLLRAKKTVPFLEVLEIFNVVLAKAYSVPPRPPAAF